MATALTLKQAIAAVWQKFMGVIGYADISGIGDGTVKGAIAGLNGKLNTKTYDQGGITVNKINDMCFCNLNITFDNTIEPWGGTWYLGNIADPEFRAPYEKHFPCVGINQEAGISYALRISVTASGNVTIINDTKDYISPKLIYANFSYRFES